MPNYYKNLQAFKSALGLQECCESLTNEWCVGGKTGGRWGHDDEPHAFTGGTEPHFAALEDALMKVAPDITYLLYRKLERELVKEGPSRRSDWDSYGNYADYESKVVSVKDLYKFLLEHSVIAKCPARP